MEWLTVGKHMGSITTKLKQLTVSREILVIFSWATCEGSGRRVNHVVPNHEGFLVEQFVQKFCCSLAGSLSARSGRKKSRKLAVAKISRPR